MANEEHLYMLTRGVKIWNAWYRSEEGRGVKPDFSGADLTGVDLKGLTAIDANLEGARLAGADLRGAWLNRANLREVDLSDANLEQINLAEADLYRAKLLGANLYQAYLLRVKLRRANLTRADLERAYLKEADLSAARLDWANLRHADLSLADCRRAYFRGADLSGADLTSASLVNTTLEQATIENCSVYGISAWGLKLKDAKQSNLIITPANEPSITVDNLELAQFIYLLLNHKKLRDILNSLTEKGVLLLGRFGGGGLEILQAIAEKLREMQYLPIIFDFDKPVSRDYTETIQTLAGLSRFVIVDLSGPSVPQELYATVPHIKIPYIPIIEKGRNTYSLFTTLLQYDWVLRPPVEFVNLDNLIEMFPSKVVGPAEEACQKRQELLNQIFGES